MSKTLRLPKLLTTACAVLVLVVLSVIVMQQKPSLVRALGGAIRGELYDKWADVVLGKRDFTEITDEMTTADHAMGGGVVVDRRNAPGFAYIWDAMHSRILGVDLGDCYALPEDTRCSATLVIGQPSLEDYGACNQDGSFQYYPDRAPSSASTLCSIPEWTHTTLEDKSYTSMFLDADYNLWVFDTQNNRVLKYIDPVNTDTVADDVWGQADFIGNKCNLTAQWPDAPPQPTAESLCFWTIAGGGAGVTLDLEGNLWVADGGNNRVLRFPKDTDTGQISKTADVVLGQADFTTGGDWSNGSDPDRLWNPTVVRFGSDGHLYVLDDGNSRILRFDAPYSNGMAASQILFDDTDFPDGVSYLEVDPTGGYLWTGSSDGGPNTDFKKWALDGTYQNVTFSNWLQAAGSLGFDTEGNILIPDNDIVRYLYDSGTGEYSEDKYFFRFWEGTGTRVASRLSQGGWGGIVFKNNQLVVVDGRILFWDDPADVTNGQTPTGYVGAANILESNDYIEMTADENNRIYVQQSLNTIKVFESPLTNGASAIQTITGPFDVLGGGQISVSFISGMAVSANSEFLWINDVDNSRVIRIRDPLTAPLVDVVLGQENISDHDCNRNIVPARDPGVQLDMICQSGSLAFDKLGNLFVSDTFFEAVGNFRVLMFSPDTFPDDPPSVVFAPAATKEFPYPNAILSTAFDSTNRMVVGYNPYAGPRFVEYFDDPADYNPLNPSDPDFATPSGQLEDFYGWAFASASDDQDNLFVYDTNRGKVLLYLSPFGAPEPTPSPSPSPTPTPSPTPEPSPTPSPEASQSGPGTSNGNSPASAPGCDATTPGSAPTLFQISSSVGSVTLYFTPVSPADSYYVAYGYVSGDQRFGASVAESSSGVLSYTVRNLAPGVRYYFSVRAQNGCQPGPWGNVRSVVIPPEQNLTGVVAEKLAPKLNTDRGSDLLLSPTATPVLPLPVLTKSEAKQSLPEGEPVSQPAAPATPSWLFLIAGSSSLVIVCGGAFLFWWRKK